MDDANRTQKILRISKDNEIICKKEVDKLTNHLIRKLAQTLTEKVESNEKKRQCFAHNGYVP